jgi:hypothetical protein
MSSLDFDWVKDDSVVIKRQPALAIYQNAAGDIVVRSEGDYSPDEDGFVYIRPEHAARVCAAIMAYAEPQKRITDQRKGRQLTLENV